jgi:protein-tyrosine phosphatase
MPPFTVLHICMGNICRSPMAERLLRVAVARLAPGGDGDPLVHSHSAGTGGWHAGGRMNPPAARQVRARGGDDSGFRARRLRSEHIDASDLVLCATGDQQLYVRALRPDAAARTFVLGQLGRLLPQLDVSVLPPVATTPAAVQARGLAVVRAADLTRGDVDPVDGDDLDDPWGRGDLTFARVADEIERTLQPLAAALLLP